MRLILAFIALCQLAGCVSPPKPKECEGEFRPVNGLQKSAALSASENVALCLKGDSHARV